MIILILFISSIFIKHAKMNNVILSHPVTLTNIIMLPLCSFIAKKIISRLLSFYYCSYHVLPIFIKHPVTLANNINLLFNKTSLLFSSSSM